MIILEKQLFLKSLNEVYAYFIIIQLKWSEWFTLLYVVFEVNFNVLYILQYVCCKSRKSYYFGKTNF